MKRILSAYGVMMGLLVFSTGCNSGALQVLSTSTPLIPTALVTLTPVPPTATPTLPVSTATPTSSAPGTVSGSVCYPSDQNPPLVLYLQNAITGDLTELDIPQGQPEYSLTLSPGEYIAYALTVGTELAGSYTRCSLSATCTDHRPLSFKVQNGQTTAGIDLCDWYTPPGSSHASPTAETVIVTTLQKMNVFTGPGLEYPLAGFAPSRASAPALGRNEDGSWLQIKYPAATGSAWIYSPLIQVSGPIATLPLAISEGTPAKTLPGKDQFIPTAWSASPNAGVVHFKGSLNDKNGNPVNGFSILADNGTWSVLSHPTGASHWYPDLKDGQWDIIITNATDAAGWWTLTVVSYDCPDFEAGFNAQCKQFTRLSENQLVKIVYPNETVIDANWVCQQECDQGLYIEAYRP